MTDYYEILGVDKNATKDEIKSAFRKKARQLHPDVNKAPDAEEKFKALGKAYETLSDENKKATYDQFGEDGLNNAGFSGAGPFANGFGDLNDIFESFFGGGFGFSGGSRQRDPNAPEVGDDLRIDIELEFEQGVFGCKKEVKFDHLEVCSACKGTGCAKDSKPVKCPTCHGSGKVRQTTNSILGSFTQITTCPDCGGRGVKITTPCKICNGKGRIEKEKTLELKIPQGVDTGSKMRLAQEGDAGRNGGPAGDLYVVLHVKPSEYFKREDVNIFTNLEISPAQAVLGDEIEIKTLDGNQKITVPTGVQNGNTIKLKGKGVPFIQRPSQRGDHIVVVTVKTPTAISDEEKQLYKKLYEINTNKKSKESMMDKVKGVFQ